MMLERYTEKAKKVLELSLREALQLGHNYIGTEHLLMALTRDDETVAAQVLKRLGVELTAVRKAVIERVTNYSSVQALQAEIDKLQKQLDALRGEQ